MACIFGTDHSGVKTVFLKTSLRSIFNECLYQLYILRNINVENDITFPDEIVEYRSLKERYEDTEMHADYRINLKSSNYNKLATDINRLINIIREGNEEINFGGTCSGMVGSIAAINQMREDDMQLLRQKVEYEEEIEMLRCQCEEERLNNIQTIDDTNTKIQKLKFEVEDVRVYGRYEISFFKNWEAARREQNCMACDAKETLHSSTMATMTNKIELENRCHLELENFIEESRNDSLEGIQYWMKHYDEEIEKRDSDMMNLKIEIEKITEEYARMKDTYELRKAAISDYMEYKRIKKEKEDQEKMECQAATKIQAWWKGVMVRKKLGPYRKKKGKGKSKTKINKKKK
ncbi:unnamed protein product [Phaedon cochleariae]|uniref:Dynein regulatory complex protein 9 n=1 Tax=Phaedon cochleariae TaxID=80249 RepID=A0A9N9SJ69_PHACE|nr:unnamed protein product [Phaedon cochleariae]